MGEWIVNSSRNQVHNASSGTTKEFSNYVQIQMISFSSIPKSQLEVFLDFPFGVEFWGDKVQLKLVFLFVCL